MDANERVPVTASLSPERLAQLFPVLTPAQIERFAAVGRTRTMERGEILVGPGERLPRFYVVLEGDIEILQADGNDRLISILRPGMFTGEVTMLSGRGVMVRLRAGASGSLIEIENARMLSLVQTDDELGDLVL
ncbi:MAG TPA: cyclic nucleotide-binding domain-containing protein, partial [Thermoanaerobaculia bacterium]|nr:cyclic nucleotide-binding domain-containing protein [Thermoanaerobaculia bacterium]